ncbi:MAG: LamG domain-containing protein [Candidatus Kapaibacterium sp.]
MHVLYSDAATMGTDRVAAQKSCFGRGGKYNLFAKILLRFFNSGILYVVLEIILPITESTPMKKTMMLLMALIALISCNDFTAPEQITNGKEVTKEPAEIVYKKQRFVTVDSITSTIVAVTPYNDAPNVTTTTSLEWGNSNASANTVYHVFFDTTFPPQKKIADTYATHIDLSVLRDSTFYYWYVVAEDDSRAIQSSVFMFRTIPIDASTTTGLLAYYPFNGNANDVVGNHHGIVVGGAASTPDRYGNPGAAYMFNGKSQYIRVKNSPELNFTNTYTLSVWVKPNANVGNSFLDRVYLVSYWGEGGRNLGAYALSLTNTLTPVSMIHDGVFTSQFISPVALKPDVWSYVVITRDMNSVMHIYVNGKQVATQSMNSPQDSRYDLLFGASFTGNDQTCAYFAGCMDNIRIYNRSLSSSEITYLWERGM